MTPLNEPQFPKSRFPASIATLKYNAKMRRDDLASARAYSDEYDEGRPWVLAGSYGAAATEHDAAAEALELWPQMAEAIIAWDDCPGSLHVDIEAKLIGLAAKLRAIGGAS